MGKFPVVGLSWLSGFRLALVAFRSALEILRISIVDQVLPQHRCCLTELAVEAEEHDRLVNSGREGFTGGGCLDSLFIE